MERTWLGAGLLALVVASSALAGDESTARAPGMKRPVPPTEVEAPTDQVVAPEEGAPVTEVAPPVDARPTARPRAEAGPAQGMKVPTGGSGTVTPPDPASKRVVPPMADASKAPAAKPAADPEKANAPDGMRVPTGAPAAGKADGPVAPAHTETRAPERTPRPDATIGHTPKPTGGPSDGMRAPTGGVGKAPRPIDGTPPEGSRVPTNTGGGIGKAPRPIDGTPPEGSRVPTNTGGGIGKAPRPVDGTPPQGSRVPTNDGLGRAPAPVDGTPPGGLRVPDADPTAPGVQTTPRPKPNLDGTTRVPTRPIDTAPKPRVEDPVPAEIERTPRPKPNLDGTPRPPERPIGTAPKPRVEEPASPGIERTPRPKPNLDGTPRPPERPIGTAPKPRVEGPTAPGIEHTPRPKPNLDGTPRAPTPEIEAAPRPKPEVSKPRVTPLPPEATPRPPKTPQQRPNTPRVHAPTPQGVAPGGTTTRGGDVDLDLFSAGGVVTLIHSGYDRAGGGVTDVYHDPGVGVQLGVRPWDHVGAQVQLIRFDDDLGSASSRVNTTVGGSLLVFPTGRTPVAPYLSGGMTFDGRNFDDIYDDGTGQRRFQTKDPTFGPHLGLGVEFTLARVLVVDVEARGMGFVDHRADDPTIPFALATSVGLGGRF